MRCRVLRAFQVGTRRLREGEIVDLKQSEAVSALNGGLVESLSGTRQSATLQHRFERAVHHPVSVDRDR